MPHPVHPRYSHLTPDILRQKLWNRAARYGRILERHTGLFRRFLLRDEQRLIKAAGGGRRPKRLLRALRRRADFRAHEAQQLALEAVEDALVDADPRVLAAEASGDLRDLTHAVAEATADALDLWVAAPPALSLRCATWPA